MLAYLNDTIIIGKSKTDAEKAVQATIDLLAKLGFIIHPDKSVIKPAKKI